MSDRLARHVAAKKGGGDDSGDDAGESDRDRRVRAKIISEAKEAGATLGKPDAKGGLDPSLVLGVFRRDEWKCTACSSQEKIGPHHKGGIVSSPRMSRAGHKNTYSNLTILCEACHDREHEDARDEGIDSSQVLPEGDVGSKRDHGDKPVAKG